MSALTSSHRAKALLGRLAKRANDQCAPIYFLGVDPFMRRDPRLRDDRLGPDRGATLGHLFGGVGHQPTELDDRQVRGPMHIGMPLHRAAHRHLHHQTLVGNSRHAGEIALFHRLAVLQEIVFERA